MTITPRQWWQRGTTTELAGRRVFAVDAGAGPDLTLLHGYPASSLEWGGVLDDLAGRHRVLAPDFVGFGASAKPRTGAIGIDLQADVVEALWAHHGVERTSIVAYDYGAIVTQELLARSREGRLAVQVDAVVLGNAGLHHEVYRPRPFQRVLKTPVLGDLLAHVITEPRFRAAWAPAFGPEHPLSEDAAAQHYAALTHDGGLGLQRRVLGYIGERARRSDRWEGVLDADAPIAGLVWGMADPVSGAHVLASVRGALPQARVVELDGVGHCPHIEVPEAWAARVLELLA
ncbi:alpha/beta hydrolase [Patulibacter sp. NPDC049589]|uniref:alpha/beta fold hydrolase n=1 Tax=Patulibacter sp. NPDC049589 TaxID=3154731 RepID=UPI00341EFA3A